MAKRPNQDIKNKASRSYKTKKRAAANTARKAAIASRKGTKGKKKK